MTSWDQVPTDGPTVTDASHIEINQRIADMISDGQLVDGRVILPNSGVSVRAVLGDDGSYGRATIYLWLDHPDWDRTFFETASAYGFTEEEAISQTILNTYLRVFQLIDHLGTSTPDERVATTFAGNRHAWSLWCGYITTSGESVPDIPSDGAPYYTLLRPEILARLGNQKVAHVKITAGRQGNQIVAEVRMNNIISPEMSDLLSAHIAATWPDYAEVIHKQLIWIKQDEDTYLPTDRRYSDVKKQLIVCAKVFQDMWISPGDKYDKAEYERLVIERSHDRSLGLELVSLLPEIAAQQLYPHIRVSENVVLHCDGVDVAINIHQLSSYAHVCEALDSTWCEEVNEEVVCGWVESSAVKDFATSLPSNPEQAAGQLVMKLTLNVGPGHQLS
ncbi:MAG: DUF6348 family protein [Propionibacteriaceae bacterium]|nr:DUF6348 family protein [Propionibacteriaceae bacterium]